MLIDTPVPDAAWPSLSELADKVGVSLTTISRALRARGARLIERGREVQVSPSEAVAYFEERGLPHELARDQVERLVEARVERIPALRERMRPDSHLVVPATNRDLLRKHAEQIRAMTGLQLEDEEVMAPARR